MASGLARRVVCCAVFGVVGVGAGVPAWAQTTGQGTYTGVTPPQLGSQQTGVAPAQAALVDRQSSQLPFTGSDVVELAGIGVVLIGSGALLRRSARARRSP
jgi:hypothetical protein